MMRFGAMGYFGLRAAGPRGGRRGRLPGGLGLLAVAAAAALMLPGAVRAQDAGQPMTEGPGPAGAAGITFFTGPDFSGTSKTLTLAPDQPYAAIPFVGSALNEKIGSLRADPQVGAILFQRPHFASRDDACGPNLGSAEDPDAWWLGLTADFAPPLYGGGPYEAATLPDDDYSSVIAYRRDLGPPPGFLLLERRSYYNRACERSADQSYFNRLFVPVPNPPQREACTDLSTPATAQGAGPDAPSFVRVSEAVALFPESFDRRYGRIDHRFVLTVFDQPGCSGNSITLPGRAQGRPASYNLSDYEFERRAESVMIRYQSGPLDRYLATSNAPAETVQAPQPALPAAGALDSTSSEAAMPQTAPEPAAAPGSVEPQIEEAADQATPTTQPANQAASQPASQAPSQAVSEAPPPAPLPSGGGLQPAPPSAPQPQQQQAAPAPLSPGGGLQPEPPSAPQPQQEALQPAPELRTGAAQELPQDVPTRPTGPPEETFRFPVHQVYRLNYCLSEEEGCGEPAANRWCEDRGFSHALRWTQEENIGALYPTVFLGNGSICDKFLCDGFEEITCTR